MLLFCVGLVIGFAFRESFDWLDCLLGRDDLSKARTALQTASSVQRSTSESEVVDMGSYNLRELINAAYLEKMAYQVRVKDGCSAIEEVSLSGYPDVLTDEVVSRWVAEKRRNGFTADGTARHGARAFRLETANIAHVTE